ncbi:MAG TPA: hypothetical protein VM534_06730, partial [Thermoanaerobaculia bacterium]|nr:hypothetical protein [Thermoanaerobaculia bacterium]
AAAPLLVDDQGRPQQEFQLRRLPTLRSLASNLLLLDRLIPRNRIQARHRYHGIELSQVQRIEQPAGAALLMRRDLVDEIGPLDERFRPAWFEDVDYCRRIHDAGRWVDLVPDAVISHRGGTSLEHLSYGEFQEIWYRNLHLYARKWMTRGEVEAVRWMILVGSTLRILAIATGVASVPVGRKEGIRAHLQVLKKAFARWGESASS